MIGPFLSLNLLRFAGLGLGYGTIVFLNRARGPEALGEYLFLLTSVIVVGTLASLGLPTLVQRLSAKLDGTAIGAGAREALRGRGLSMCAIAAAGALAITALDTERSVTLARVGLLALAALCFALILILVEIMRVAQGPQASELQRNVVRPVLILALLLTGLSASAAVTLGVVTAAALIFWLSRATLRQPRGSTQTETFSTYVAERSADLNQVFALSALGLVFGAMDVVLFGLLADDAETGIYGAGSRFGMLINVALLAGNAQMVRHLAKVAAGTDPDGQSLALMRMQIRLVRLTGSALALLLIATLPLYAWIVDLPASRLWPYFAVVAGSFWLQGMLGPVNMFLLQAQETGRLIVFHLWGVAAFAVVWGLLYAQGTLLAVPAAAAVGANSVKLLAWLRIRRSRNLLL